MNFIKRPLVILACTLLTLPASVFGQYMHDMHLYPFFSYFGDAQRYDLAFNYVMPMGYFEGVQRVTNGSYIGDTTIRRNIVGTGGMGGSIGLNLPFKATGHISCWAATIALGVNMYTWTNINSTYGSDGSLVAPTGDILSASTMQISLPIGIDWKCGNDAIKTKRLPFGTSLGAGFIPQYNMTSLSNANGIPSGSRFGFTPYAKAEISMFLGIDIKVRATYTMGTVSLIDVNRPVPGMTDGPFKIVHTSSIMASLIFMPFSGGWHEYNWWNTRDTYNWHDRFN